MNRIDCQVEKYVNFFEWNSILCKVALVDSILSLYEN
ncbi:hypothetical protein UJ101_02557 [Flavobacteriaceae bacterium UJ101]|nr:hypothetical protein UJ101_02557 [Flavobacteriaceae bacterium UJ101]